MRIARPVMMGGIFLAGATWVSVTLVRAGVLGGSPIPADVRARSDIARANMRLIAIAMMMYVNENNGSFPPDLAMLYPGYISDPAVFWHPGDSDPRPTTINNNTPNQPNSTRISYAFASNPDQRCGGDLLLWDNSAANNGGYFINQVTLSATVQTDPPFVTPTPTRLQVAQANLKNFYRALYTYAADNRDCFPDDPKRLADWRCPSSSAKSFWNSGDIDPAPTQITNSTPNAPDSAQVSFTFLTTGRRTWEFGFNDILVQDNSPANNGGRGINVLKNDGKVYFIPACPAPLADADRDGDVDQDDFGLFQRCVTIPGTRLADGCGCFDNREGISFPYGDGDVDQADLDRFLACMAGPEIPVDPACGGGPG